jgi:imidazole glycerol-phosphate synthase subunit HisH
MTTIAVIDYGMGNLRSVSKAVEHVAPDAQVVVTSEAAVVDAAARVVFPGQGAMPDCMRELERAGLRDAVVRATREKPLLGICIGAQMLFDWSAEGDTPGLGIFRGKVVRFPHDRLHAAPGGPLKVPHMGWNRVRQGAAHPLWGGIRDDDRFYFCHSYFFVPEESGLACGASEHGVPFTCAVARDNIFAVQFHPEKSHTAGLQLLANFVSWNP